MLSLVRLLATPWTVVHRAPLSWDFPGKNTGVGCHFLHQGRVTLINNTISGLENITDAEAETPVLWSPDVKNWLTQGKDPDAGKDWKWEKKGTTEEEMVGWHHRLDGHELSKLREFVIDREAWCATVHGVAKNRIQLSDWTELNWKTITREREQFKTC